MRIAVIGSGYVGLVAGTCFAESGNNVICVDIDERKVNDLKNGKIPIYEPGLEEMVKHNVKEERLSFTTNTADAVQASEVVFIAVGTPPGEDGSADLKYVLGVAKEIGKAVSFASAAFRQAFAGGRDLTDPENVMLAAAACELHPRAVEQAAGRDSVKAKLREATDEAADLGVFGVPSIVVRGEVFWGDDRIEEAVEAAG